MEEARERLLALRGELRTLDDDTASDRAPVELDQTSVGRVSRIDAIQRQEMAKAGRARRLQELARIEAALARIEDGSYGECLNCGEPIAPGRLKLDPAAAVCIACARGED